MSCREIPSILLPLDPNRSPPNNAATIASKVQPRFALGCWRSVAVPGKLSRGLFFRVEL